MDHTTMFKKRNKVMSNNIKIQSKNSRISNQFLKNNNLKVNFSTISLTSNSIQHKILLFLKKLKHCQKKVSNKMIIARLREKFNN